MNALWLILFTAIAYIVAYHSYGRFLAKRIFKLNPKAKTPAYSNEDGKDFIPSNKQVVFGHHFTSIAGTGPIVGPAIGVIWGWLPAMLWIVLGSIFMGAVHDFSALVISLRNEGRSIADSASRYINARVRIMFFMVICLALWIVIAIFGLVIALVFSQFPQSVIPIWSQIPIAIALGYMAFKKGLPLNILTAIAVLAMGLSIVIGSYVPLHMPSFFSLPATGVWTIILLMYAFIASILPVQVLLQPRDYINAWQLYISLGLIVLAILLRSFFGSSLDIVAPIIKYQPQGAPPLLPFLCITIACGAVSGFHSLICSGTSSKQLKTETDAQFVGYGAMITEAFLATIIVVAVTAGIGIAYTHESGNILTGYAAWQAHYGSWTASAGLGSKLNAVVIGCANIMQGIGLSHPIGVAIMGVFIASFAATTLDSATRIQRYVITELCSSPALKPLRRSYVATCIAVFSAMLLAFSSGMDGKGALALWPMFGALNQLLAALALLVASAYLKTKGGLAYLVVAIPCVVLMGLTLWASAINQWQFIQQANLLLSLLNALIIVLALAMLIESIRESINALYTTDACCN